MEHSELIELMQKRVSVRSYLEKDISEDDIGKLIECVRWAPTSCNRQSWKVTIVRKDTKKFDLLARANFGGAGFANNAPVLLLLTVDLRTYGMPREMNFPVNDGSIVASYFMLGATSLGLDSCWISWQAALKTKKKIYKELELEPYLFPICVLTLGYRKDEIIATPREDINYYIV
jgi:nitroreductase